MENGRKSRMLKVQEKLLSLEGSVQERLEQLKSELGIQYKIHEDGRIILDYHQIESPKLDEIVRECRGLVLDSEFYLVARGFRRFFNAGEVRDEDKKFNWNCEVICSHKEDGSFILLYQYRGEWKINTRFSFAELPVQGGALTWTELFKLALDFDKAPLDPNFTYVFELCSRYNKVVRDYKVPQVYLLTMFQGEHEVKFEYVEEEALQLGIKSAEVIKAQDIFDVQQYITQVASNDKTFEGIVVRDVHNNRLKLKSDYYLVLHRLHDNGNLGSMPKLLKIILDGEQDEILVYFPELEEKLALLSQKVADIITELDNVWFCHHDERSQKQFALAVTKATKYTGPLFSARKLGGHPKDYLTAEYLVKYVY